MDDEVKHTRGNSSPTADALWAKAHEMDQRITKVEFRIEHATDNLRDLQDGYRGLIRSNEKIQEFVVNIDKKLDIFIGSYAAKQEANNNSKDWVKWILPTLVALGAMMVSAAHYFDLVDKQTANPRHRLTYDYDYEGREPHKKPKSETSQ